jgi:hypothetical protein
MTKTKEAGGVIRKVNQAINDVDAADGSMVVVVPVGDLTLGEIETIGVGVEKIFASLDSNGFVYYGLKLRQEECLALDVVVYSGVRPRGLMTWTEFWNMMMKPFRI